MKNPSSEPKWLNNHWKILSDLLNRADFKEEIEAIRQDRAQNEYAPPMLIGDAFVDLMQKHSVPLSCARAIEYLISHPDASEQQLKTRLSAPVRWVSHYHKEAGPSGDTLDEYKVRTHFGVSTRADALNIEIMPHTKVSEVKDFIERNSKDISRLLQNPSEDSEWLFPQRLSKRIDKPNKLVEDILTLHYQGKTSTEIAEVLNISDRVDQPNIRKSISLAKKKRNNASK